MNIVIPLLNLSLSGGVRIALQYSEGLADRGHDVCILLPSNVNKDFIDLPRNITLVKVKVPKYLAILGYLGTIISMRKNLPDCDAVLAISWHGVFVAFKTKVKSSKIFHLIQHDDSVINGNRTPFIKLRNNLLFKYVYHLKIKKIVVSSWLQKVMKEKYSEETICIPNGIAPNAFEHQSAPTLKIVESDSFDILCLARQVKWKGFEDLIVAVRILLKSDVKLRVIVATREKVIVPNDIPHIMVRPNNDSELGWLYRNCDVFAFPSWTEGFGLPPLEAMLCGSTVVTTDCGGINDYARHNENCLIVPPHAPEKLAEAIYCIYRDPDLAGRLAREGLKTAQAFSIHSSIKKVEELLMTSE